MKVAISVGAITADNIQSVTGFVQHAERLGVFCAWSHEAWGSDNDKEDKKWPNSALPQVKRPKSDRLLT